MRIVFEKGKAGLWYATAENCEGLYRGLLIVGPTLDSVIDMIPAAFKDLRDAAALRYPQASEEAK